MSGEFSERKFDHDAAVNRLLAAVMDEPAWYYEGFGECAALTEDGVCGYSLDERGRCWVRSRHVAAP
jgi:hypothetical protein